MATFNESLDAGRARARKRALDAVAGAVTAEQATDASIEGVKAFIGKSGLTWSLGREPGSQ